MKKTIGIFLFICAFCLLNRVTLVKAASNSEWSIEGESLYDALLPYVEYEMQEDRSLLSVLNTPCNAVADTESCNRYYISLFAKEQLDISNIKFIVDANYTTDAYLSIDLSKNGNDDVVVYIKNNGNKLTDVEVVTKNRLLLNSNSSHLFENLNLTSITGLNNLNTVNVTDMSYMFADLTKITELDLSSFVTMQLTKTDNMFLNDNKLETIYASKWFVTDKVISSTDMFKGCTLLKGENNTEYDASNIDKNYARIDTLQNPGYLSSKGTETYLFVEDTDISNISDYTYTGSSITPNITVSYGNIILEKDTDYTVTYTNNINVGTAKVTIRGKGNFAGTITKTFRIKQAGIASATISAIGVQTYTGSAITPNVSVNLGGKNLVKDKDYVITYSNNINTGLATATIRGTGNYSQTVNKTFVVKPKAVTGLKASSQTQSSITLSWNKNGGLVTGYEIYEFNYKKQKWEYKTTTTSNSYTYKKLTVATIHRYKVRAYKTINGTKQYGDFTLGFSTSTKTKTPSIKKITTKSKKATITWKKVTNASGYEVYMSTKKSSGYKKIKTTTAKKYTKTKLKKGKTYYFKVRTYRTVQGVKIYSYYSSIKKIKVK